eukprot:gene15426-4628_t
MDMLHPAMVLCITCAGDSTAIPAIEVEYWDVVHHLCRRLYQVTPDDSKRTTIITNEPTHHENVFNVYHYFAVRKVIYWLRIFLRKIR